MYVASRKSSSFDGGRTAASYLTRGSTTGAAWTPAPIDPTGVQAFPSSSDEPFLGLRVENVELVVRDGEFDSVARLNPLLRRDEGDDLVTLGLRVDELLVAQVLDD